MVTKPAPIVTERQNKQVLFKDIPHEFKPVLRFGIERTQDKFAKFGVEFLRQRGAHEELTDRLRLLIEHLTAKVGKCVHPRDPRHARRIGENHTGDPAAGLVDQLFGGFFREVLVMILGIQRLYLTRVERQLRMAETRHLLTGDHQGHVIQARQGARGEKYVTVFHYELEEAVYQPGDDWIFIQDVKIVYD